MVIHATDTVVCLLRDHSAGEQATLSNGETTTVQADTPMGHKIARVPIAKGATVIKYGAPIGFATVEIRPGEHVHLHNLKGGL